METLTLDTLGFALAPEPTRSGSKLYCVETPFRFFNDAPFDVFIERTGWQIYVFDDGLTMHEIIIAGVDMADADNWSRLRAIVDEYHVSLSPTGVFEIFSADPEAAVGNFLRALIAVDDWLRKRLVEA